jgi:hypothetical protein
MDVNLLGPMLQALKRLLVGDIVGKYDAMCGAERLNIVDVRTSTDNTQ